MKIQHQTKFGAPEGNCFATCVASMLDLEVADVPNFCSLGSDWWVETVKWLRARGYDAVDIKSLGEMVCAPGVVFIASGPSPRGDFDHSVLCMVNGKMEFQIFMDPHPDGTGLAGPFKSACFLLKHIQIPPEKT